MFELFTEMWLLLLIIAVAILQARDLKKLRIKLKELGEQFNISKPQIKSLIKENKKLKAIVAELVDYVYGEKK